MIKSMYSGVTGLRAQQTRMDVIGNNIANVNTVGFKSSRVVFQDLYYQTIQGATAASLTKGGSNPRAIGYGAQVASIDVMNGRSGMTQTDRTMDAYISGEGYFVVQDGANEKYTRVGDFSFDETGALVDQNGCYVKGTIGNGTPDYTTNAPVAITLDGLNGHPDIGAFSNVAISKDGSITGLNSSGQLTTLAHIAVAKFTNPDGLSQLGGSYVDESSNSGKPVYEIPGTNATGSLISGALEMSNVDLSKEFTDMITTQRGFQANARVITTSDEILQELVQLKR